jgi:hypothetical protein
VYDGYFLRGNLTAVVRLSDGHVQNEQIAGYGPGAYQPESLEVRLREAKHLLTQVRQRERSSRGPRKRALAEPYEARIRELERRVDYERLHPGLLPAE